MNRARFVLRLALLVIASGLANVGPAGATSEPSSGMYLYRRHCANCHGLDANGDGPNSIWLAARPRNLRGGWLSQQPLERLIDRVIAGRALRLEIDPQAMRQRATDVDAVVAHLERLARVDWDEVDAGWESYLMRCESCHGAYGQPSQKVPGSTATIRDLGDPAYQKATSDSELLQAIQHGRRGMPALVPQVHQEDAVELLQFVRLLSPGFKIYSEACAGCHGEDGRGAGSLAEPLDMPSVVFNSEYFAEVDREALLVKAWHMVGKHKPLMPHFQEELSRDQVRAILEYLGAITPTPLPAGAPDGAADPIR